jgi:hypothetical protein
MMSAQAVLSAAPIAAVAARRTPARSSRAVVAARRAPAVSLPAGASSEVVTSRRGAAGVAPRRIAARASRGTAAAAAAFGKAVVAAADGKGEKPVILVAEKLGKGGARRPGVASRERAWPRANHFLFLARFLPLAPPLRVRGCSRAAPLPAGIDLLKAYGTVVEAFDMTPVSTAHCENCVSVQRR